MHTLERTIGPYFFLKWKWQCNDNHYWGHDWDIFAPINVEQDGANAPGNDGAFKENF